MSGRVQGRSPTAEDHARLADVVRAFMRDALGPDAVVGVILRNDIDSDGDDLLRVFVITGDQVVPDGRKLVGFTRHLRSEMEEFDHFPITSFLTEADLDQMGRGPF